MHISGPSPNTIPFLLKNVYSNTQEQTWCYGRDFLGNCLIYYLLSSILDNNSYYDYLQTTSPKAMELVGGHTTAEDCGNSRRRALQSPLEPEEIRLSPTGEVINREIRPGNKQPILLRICLPITVVINIQVKCLEIIEKQTHNPKIPIISLLRNTYHDHFP